MPGTDVAVTSNDAQSQEDALNYAALILRHKNVKEFHTELVFAGMMTFPNGAAIESGKNINILNKGIFSGKWIIQNVKWSLRQGKMETEMNLRRCLIGPPPYGNPDPFASE